MFTAKIGDDRYRDFRPIAPLKGPAGFRNAPFESWPISVGHLVINSKSKNAAALLKWADFFYSLEGTLYNRYGMKGKGWELEPKGTTDKDYDGNPAVWKQLREWDPNSFINESFFDTGVWNMDATFRPSVAAPQGLDLWSAEGNEQQLYLTTKKLYKPYAHNEMALPPLKFTPSREPGRRGPQDRAPEVHAEDSVRLHHRRRQRRRRLAQVPGRAREGRRYPLAGRLPEGLREAVREEVSS